MNYLLAVLSHGRNERMMRQAIAAWHEHATPAPAEVLIHHDTGRAGFCAATAALWTKAAASDYDYVLWLEHDFLLTRPVDLRDLAVLLDSHVIDGRPNMSLGDYPLAVAQMALMRDAYSDEEKAAGGLFELRRADFQAMPNGWLRQPYFTTNPSLMRRDFMAANPFPDDGEPHCEGRFSIALREQCWSFGTWGDGSVYVNHIGRRDGSGHGY